VRENELGGEDAIYAGTVTRAMCSHPQSRSVDPESLATLLEAAEHVPINARGRTHELFPIDVDPGIEPTTPLDPT